MSGPILAGAWLAFLLVDMVRPVVRVYRRTGTFPVAFDKDGWQRAMGPVFGVLLLGVPAWGVLLGVYGPGLGWGWEAPAVLAAAGWVLMAASMLFVVVAQDQMADSWQVGIVDRSTELVTTGLFRWVRNPIFTGMLGFVTGTVLVAPSPVLLGAAALTWLLLAVQVRIEETHLVREHGASYLQWASRTGRFLPGLGKLGV